MKKSFVIHPFLLAIFPILFLFSHNINELSISQIVIPIAITISFTFLLWLLLSFILKDKEKAGLIVSLFLFLFFSYGHFHGAIGSLVGQGVEIWRHKYLLLTWCILFTFGVYFSIETLRSLNNLTKILNVIAASLVVISLINIGSYKLKTRVSRQDNSSMKNIETSSIDLEKVATFPNIYYIILDGYAREDILKEIYQYENRELLDYLTKKGFYIANRSRSNYCQTNLSLASSLNFKYLDDLVNQVGIETKNREPLWNMIKNNSVFLFLKQHGYVFVAFPSGFFPTEIKNADIFMSRVGFLDEFQVTLINTTPILGLLDIIDDFHFEYNLHRRRILYIFDHLAEISEFKDPIFVFAHIVAPHPPFVFGQHGEEINPEKEFTLVDGSYLIRKGGLTRDEYLKKYREQLIFINSKIKTTVDGILSKSDSPTIIILQSDHGPGSMLNWEDPDNTYFKERLSIFNAYYLPNNDYINLYEEVTPVNTFRIIFNDYFGTNYRLLKDESYFSIWRRPYKFIKVNDDINSDIDIRLPK